MQMHTGAREGRRPATKRRQTAPHRITRVDQQARLVGEDDDGHAAECSRLQIKYSVEVALDLHLCRKSAVFQ